MRVLKVWMLGVVMLVALGTGCEVMGEDLGAGTEEELGETELELGGHGWRSRSATLKDVHGDRVARVVFVPVGHGKVMVNVTVRFPGIRSGFHGYHIHANDNPANGDGCIADPAQPANTHFVSADGHWNPTAATHGEHAGDMPNVMVRDDGSSALSFINDIHPLSDIVGRAVILHEGVDNHGNVPVGAEANQYMPNSPDATTLTDNTGNAGNRIACGIIR
jgi:superoxide dismutase, Cu-Zn family